MASVEEVHSMAREEDEEVVVQIIELFSPMTRLFECLPTAEGASEGETRIVDGTLPNGG
jgi:hypothetical protein